MFTDTTPSLRMSSQDDDKDTPFSLAGTDSTFKGRSHQVFDCLNTIADKHEAFERAKPPKRPLPDSDSDDDNDTGECEETPFKFKKPMGSAPKAKVVPGFESKPNLWQHYDLSDVPCSSSDAANAATAMEFINSRTEKPTPAATEQVSTEPEAACTKHIFHKPQKTANDEKSTESTKGQKGAELTLHHISEVDEDDYNPAVQSLTSTDTGKVKFKVRRGSSDEEDNHEDTKQTISVDDEKVEDDEPEDIEDEEEEEDGLT